MRDLHFQCDPHTHKHTHKSPASTFSWTMAILLPTSRQHNWIAAHDNARARCFSRYDDDFNCGATRMPRYGAGNCMHACACVCCGIISENVHCFCFSHKTQRLSVSSVEWVDRFRYRCGAVQFMRLLLLQRAWTDTVVDLFEQV